MTTKDIKRRIKEHFLKNPTLKQRVRQIEKDTKSALPSVIRYVKEFKKEEILKKEEIANVCLYSADRSSKNYILEKKVFNIRQLSDSGLLDYLIKEYHNASIVVFGSYAKGEDIEDSDIDIYVESSRKEIIDLDIFEKKLQRKIHIIKHKNIRDIKNKNLINNIMNGIVLNGFVEVVK